MPYNPVPHAVDPYALQQECIRLLTGIVPASGAVSYTVDGARSVRYLTHAINARQHQDYLDGLFEIDPMHPSKIMSTDIRVLRMNDLIPFQQRSASPFYSAFVRSWGIRDIVELYLRVDDQLVAGAAVLRTEALPEFSTAEVNQLRAAQRFMEFTAQQLLHTPQRQAFSRFCHDYALTAKEVQVLEHLAQGTANKVIASALDCSLATVKTHLQHIFRKLEVNSKAEIIALLYRTHH